MLSYLNVQSDHGQLRLLLLTQTGSEKVRKYGDSLMDYDSIPHLLTQKMIGYCRQVSHPLPSIDPLNTSAIITQREYQL